MDRPLVLYHGPGCADGFCAAFVAWRVFGDGADYTPVQYGEAAPDVLGRRAYILDFSCKRQVMEQLIRDALSLVVLDHHASAEKELERLGDEITGRDVLIRFDMEKSG